MTTRGRSEDWGERPSRARQPLGPSGIEQKRNRGLQRALGARHGDGDLRSLESGDMRSRSGARRSQQGLRKPGEERRSRSIAVFALIVVAVIVIAGGILATTGNIGSGGSVPISILPFPQETADTTATQ